MTQLRQRTPRQEDRAQSAPRSCKYCSGPVSGRRDRVWCSGSCRARAARGVPPTKKYKPEPALRAAESRSWRVLPDLPNYEISNDGRVRRGIAGSNRKVGSLIRCALGSEGYPEYRLKSRDGVTRAWTAHRLVALAFLDQPKPGQTFVLHRDDDRLNAVDTNLRWGNAKDNAVDADRNGRIPRGETHYTRRRAA